MTINIVLFVFNFLFLFFLSNIILPKIYRAMNITLFIAIMIINIMLIFAEYNILHRFIINTFLIIILFAFSYVYVKRKMLFILQGAYIFAYSFEFVLFLNVLDISIYIGIVITLMIKYLFLYALYKEKSL